MSGSTVVDAIPLPSGSLQVIETSLTGVVGVGDEIEALLYRTAGTGSSTFNAIGATLIVDEVG